jgi:hypothetical protein
MVPLEPDQRIQNKAELRTKRKDANSAFFHPGNKAAACFVRADWRYLEQDPQNRESDMIREKRDGTT